MLPALDTEIREWRPARGRSQCRSKAASLLQTKRLAEALARSERFEAPMQNA